MGISSEIPFTLGFPSVHTSTHYYPPLGLVLGTFAGIQGDCRLCPFLVPTAGVYDRILIENTIIGEAGSVTRLGIYAADQQTYTPLLQGPILDAGTVTGDTTGVKEIVISQTLTAGLVYLAAVNQLCPTTPPTLRGVGAASGLYYAHGTAQGAVTGSAGTWQQTAMTGALATWTVGATTGGTSIAKVWLRKA